MLATCLNKVEAAAGVDLATTTDQSDGAHSTTNFTKETNLTQDEEVDGPDLSLEADEPDHVPDEPDDAETEDKGPRLGNLEAMTGALGFVTC